MLMNCCSCEGRMPARWIRRWLLATLLSATEATAQAPRPLQFSVQLEAGSIRLLQVEQHGSDLLLDVDDGREHYSINHPLGHTGHELVLLGPYDTATRVRITAPVLDGRELGRRGDADALAYALTPLPPNDPALPAWRAITTAGRIIQSDSPDAWQQALVLYASVDAASLPVAWRYYADFLAARIEFQLSDLQAASARLSALPTGACTMAQYCYKARLLQQEVLLAAGDSASAIDTLTALRSELEASELSERYLADLCSLLVILGSAEAMIDDNEQATPRLEAALALARQLQSRRLEEAAVDAAKKLLQ